MYSKKALLNQTIKFIANFIHKPYVDKNKILNVADEIVKINRKPTETVLKPVLDTKLDNTIETTIKPTTETSKYSKKLKFKKLTKN